MTKLHQIDFMKKIFSGAAIVFIILLMTQCAKTKKTTSTTPSATQTNSAKIDPNDPVLRASNEDIITGRTIWQTKCAQCHKLFTPDTRTYAEWIPILKSMIPKTKSTDRDAELIRVFVLRNSKDLSQR